MHRHQTRFQTRAPLCDAPSATVFPPSAPTAGGSTIPCTPATPLRAEARTECRAASPTPVRLVVLLAGMLMGVMLMLGHAHPARAHRVNIFAWVEGGAIRCESSFVSGRPARDARVTITLADSGTVMGSAVTDARGQCALPVTPELRAAKADLIIEVQAGEGHRNVWTMPAGEYLSAPVETPGTSAVATAPGGTPPAPSRDAPRVSAPASPAHVGGMQPRTDAVIDEAVLRRIVAEAVSEQIAPLRHSLAAMQSGAPRMADVAGGIGFLVGLAGIALWARSRHR